MISSHSRNIQGYFPSTDHTSRNEISSAWKAPWQDGTETSAVLHGAKGEKEEDVSDESMRGVRAGALRGCWSLASLRANARHCTAGVMECGLAGEAQRIHPDREVCLLWAIPNCYPEHIQRNMLEGNMFILYLVWILFVYYSPRDV